MNKFLRVTKEATFGEFNGAASPTDIAWIRLTGDNSFNVNPTRNIYFVSGCDSANEPVNADSNQSTIVGTLTTPFYPTQSAFFLGLGTTLVGSGTPPSYDLGSATIDYHDGVEIRRYLGAKINSLGIALPSQGFGTLTIGFSINKVDASAPTVTTPTSSDFPSATVLPYRLQDSSGGLKLGSNTPRVNYESINVTIGNNLVAEMSESPWINYVYGGRSVSLACNFRYVNTTDRLAYENMTTQAIVDLVLARSGQKTTTFDFKGSCLVNGYAKTIKMSGTSFYALTLTSMYNAAANSSFSFTVVDP